MAQPAAQQTDDGDPAGIERLLEVVQALSLARTTAAIQEIVRHAARELADADGATFVLREGDRCYYADEDAIHPLWKGQHFPMASCISGWVMLHHATAVIEDIYHDARVPHDAYRPTFVKSLAMVPIRTRDPIGAIGVYWARAHRPDAGQLRLIQALADTTAVALENASMHVALEQRVRERTAQALAAQQQAERSHALMTRFLNAANHDLRQPLQSIGAYLTALSARAEDPATRAACTRARSAVQSMGGVLDAMLDLDRIERGTVNPVLEHVPLLPLAREVAAGNRLQAESKGLSLEVTGDDCVAVTDAALLARVLDNLVVNAIRYTERGGVTLRCEAAGKRVWLRVADTGVGIPAAARERIFEEGVQLANPGHDPAKGLGLGLSIVRQLAGILGHRLELRSEPGAGSTFSLELPLGQHRPQQERRAAPRAPATSAPVALLVEDDAAIADATLMMLKSVGIEALHVPAREGALARIQAGFRPNVLVTDFFLLCGSGLDAVQSVRAALREEIPAVILTGDTSIKPGDLAAVANCALLHKPVDGDRLVGLLHSLVARGTARAAP